MMRKFYGKGLALVLALFNISANDPGSIMTLWDIFEFRRIFIIFVYNQVCGIIN